MCWFELFGFTDSLNTTFLGNFLNSKHNTVLNPKYKPKTFDLRQTCLNFKLFNTYLPRDRNFDSLKIFLLGSSDCG